MAFTYRSAGVDIDAGDALVDHIAPLARATRTPHVISDVGGFAGLLRVPPGYREPVLVSGTDGVGTKLRIAIEQQKHGTIGQDLVAMCVNDILTVGATPLFFLDYFATGRLEVDVAREVIAGIASACRTVDCALLGGETAEMPGMYREGDYDLAGFSVGVVERAEIVDGKRCKAGDVAIALPSSGLHSNGFSLVRKIVEDRSSYEERPRELEGRSVAEALLVPTELYVKPVLALLANGIRPKAMSHITGGGVLGNVPRVLPDHLGLRVETWPTPPLFAWLQGLGSVEEREMRRTFNCGVGFVLIVEPSDEARALTHLRESNVSAFRFGSLEELARETDFESRVF